MDYTVNEINKLLKEIYLDVEKVFKDSGVDYSDVDVYEMTSELLQHSLSEMDPDSEWTVTVTYDSMKDLYNKHLTD